MKSIPEQTHHQSVDLVIHRSEVSLCLPGCMTHNFGGLGLASAFTRNFSSYDKNPVRSDH